MTRRHPLVVVPNANIGDHLCSIFNIPKIQIRVNGESLRGLGADSVVMLYTEGWENKSRQYRQILETLDISEMHGAVIISVPEIMRVYR